MQLSGTLSGISSEENGCLILALSMFAHGLLASMLSMFVYGRSQVLNVNVVHACSCPCRQLLFMVVSCRFTFMLSMVVNG